MGSFFTILANGAQSMTAHRVASATASNNINNVNTPGYARQSAVLQSVPDTLMGGLRVGNGVKASSIVQLRDMFVEGQMGGALAMDARDDAMANALEAVDTLAPETLGGLQEALSGFFSSMAALSQNPGSPAARSAMLGATRTMALAFNNTAQGLAQARSGVDSQVAATAQEVNGLTQRLASLNREIVLARGQGGGSPNQLLDARTQARDALAALTGARSMLDQDGNLSMTLPDGQALVLGDRAAVLSTQPDPALGGALAVRIQRTDGSGPVTLNHSQLGGRLGGLVGARDGALQTALGEVDGLAFDLANALNAVHTAGVGLDGVGGRALLDVAATPGGAAASLRLAAGLNNDPTRVAAASNAAGLPGGNDNLQALLAVERQAMGSGLPPAASVGALVAAYGTSTREARAQAGVSGARLESLTALREAASGVSVDEELVMLMQSQRAYEATLKVITTADEMLETLMQLK